MDLLRADGDVSNPLLVATPSPTTPPARTGFAGFNEGEPSLNTLFSFGFGPLPPNVLLVTVPLGVPPLPSLLLPLKDELDDESVGDDDPPVR